ncbi:MAG: DNA internalization-related competence protein ComEC/Rec2, partial [candidate division Zixibacteria bacterium]|nr:DNA internalization-related competence protein ComEC/Rec2 [candidate division Zixibacteria bacterium]
MRRPSFYALIFFVIGILISYLFNLPTLLLFSILILSLLFCLLFLLKRDQKGANVFIILSIILVGSFRYELLTKDFPPNHIGNFLSLNRPVTITGKIEDEPDVRDNKTFLTVKTESISQIGNPALSGDGKTIPTCGQIILKIKESTSRFDYADKVKFKGYLNEPASRRNPGAFDYKKYLNRKRIYGMVSLSKADDIEIVKKEPGNLFLSKIVIPLKEWILGVFDRTLSGNHKALLSGFLLGETRDIPKDIYNMFRNTGTVHLLAVSGSNVGLVILIIFYFLRLVRVPKLPLTIITLISIFIFANLVNNEPPVVRAGIMASVALLGMLLYKDLEMTNLVSFAALVILFYYPPILFDVGFQLSFACVFGLVLIVPKLSQIVSKYVDRSHKNLWRWIIYPSIASLAVEITVIPFLAYYFNLVPLVTIVANLLIVPLASLSIMLSCVTLFSAIFSPFLASIFSASNWLCLDLTLRLTNFFSILPIAKLNMPSPSIFNILIYYLFVWLMLSSIRHKKKALIFSLVIFGTVYTWQRVIANENHLLKLTFLDVGQGNSTVIQLPEKQTFLINSGEKWGNFDSGEYVVLPFLNKNGITKIDKFILTDNDSENLNSAKSVSENVEIGEVLIPNFDSSVQKTDEDFVKNMSNKLIFLDSIKEISVENSALRIPRGGEQSRTTTGGGEKNEIKILFLHYSSTTKSGSISGGKIVKISYKDVDFCLLDGIKSADLKMHSQFDSGFMWE